MSWRLVKRYQEVANHRVGSQRPVDLPRAVIDAVVLHQTAFVRADNVAQYDAVTAHYCVMRNGITLALHPHSAYLEASNRFNARSVAVEFVGNFPAANGRWWRPRRDRRGNLLSRYQREVTFGAHYPTQEQVVAGRHLLRYLRDQHRIRFVFAHCQANRNPKANCPGPHIWYNVGRWAIRKFGMSSGDAGFCLPDGMPIPAEWLDSSFEIPIQPVGMFLVPT